MKDGKKTLLLINPAAGRGKGKKNVSYILESLRSRIKKVEYHISEYPLHLTDLASEGIKNGFQRIISIGGDGTPFEILNGIKDFSVVSDELEFGFIPAGTGNSFLRDFMNINVDEALLRILSFKPIEVDLCEFTYEECGKVVEKYFLNILGVGLIADILELTNRKFKKFGSAGYGIAVLVRLFKGMNNRLQLKIDGKIHKFSNSALVISNSKYTGGKMKIAPDADASDGKLDVIVFDHVNRREILKIFSGVFSGRHISHPRVKVFVGKTIELNSSKKERIMADGELLGYTPLKINICKSKLKVLL